MTSINADSILETIDMIRAVSYTHLDVYKRQIVMTLTLISSY